MINRSLTTAPLIGLTGTTPTPPALPAAEGRSPDLSHEWVGAAVITLSEAQAKHAALRLSVRLPQAYVKISVLETYCHACRRPYEDVADADCSAKVNNEHLIGGDQAHRARRKPRPLMDPHAHGPVTRPRLPPRGVGGLLSGTT